MMNAGQRLGPYEIISTLGAGGMGEVYRARDTKLNRDVAIKVLLPAVANDSDRLARFSREAQVLASLNHPNIAHIYGVEEANGVTALVMELVEGEDLSQRISRGAIPIDEALPIARQIAEALEGAHDHGIIHRDLKPANIKVRPDGTVKVLDFGLAKQGSGIGAQGSGGAANSPTLSIHATEAGIILGTAAYMSPEQAAGKAVDKRTDVWAFGVVLLEMLTGRQTFAGETVSHVLAAVLKDQPDWTALPRDTPESIRKLLRRCLEKDRKRRLADAADARLELDDTQTSSGSDATHVAPAVTQPAWRRALPWAFAGVLAAALVLTLWAPWRASSAAPALMRFSAELGADVSLVLGTGDVAALSPDGTVIAFVAQKSDSANPQIYVRRLSQAVASPLAGTDDASTPFFSPDSQSIAFFQNGKLKKIPLTGGAAVTLTDAVDPRGGAWGDDGTIVFLPSPRGTLMRLAAGGGIPEAVTALADGEVSQRWPQVLPGGKGVLFTSGGAGQAYDDATLVVQPVTGPRSVILQGGYHGRYISTGHLLYMRHSTLFAVPFDLERLAVAGPPVPVLEGVATNTVTAGAQFTFAANGMGAYLPGENVSTGWTINWRDRAGNTTTLRATPANLGNPSFAPDGRRLALQITDGNPNDNWIYEWARDILTRLTFDPSNDTKPVWTHDSRRIVFTSAAPPNLFWQRSDGTGEAQRLTESAQFQQAGSWHPNGSVLAFEQLSSATGWDLMLLPMAGDEASGWKPGKPTVFLNSPFNETEAMFSPDGRWLAYVSNESGRNEIYVRPFPGPGGKWQVSADGGVTPTWSRAKPELLYGTLSGQIMVAAHTTEGESFRAEKSRLWSEGRYVVRGSRMFDLHPDGTRVAMATATIASEVKHDKLTFLFNFLDELRRIAPAAKP